MKLLAALFLTLFTLTLWAAPMARVAITVNGSPCTGGPVNCTLLQTGPGKIRITSEAGFSKTVSISSTGLTVISLAEGTYTFKYLISSPVGSSTPVTQDIVVMPWRGRNLNSVTLNYDTGIR